SARLASLASLLIFAFVLLRDAAPLRLHSFPTRRSSDLIAVVLFVASGFMRARGMGVRDPKAAEKPKAAGAGQAEGIAGPAPTAPQPGAQQPRKAQKKGKPAGGDDDFGDIEDLLRKHGIE